VNLWVKVEAGLSPRGGKNVWLCGFCGCLCFFVCCPTKHFKLCAVQLVPKVVFTLLRIEWYNKNFQQKQV